MQPMTGNNFFKVFYVASGPVNDKPAGEATACGIGICVGNILSNPYAGTTVASRLNATLAHELAHAQVYCLGPDPVPALDDPQPGDPNHSVNVDRILRYGMRSAGSVYAGGVP